MQRLHGRREEIAGIEGIVAQEIINSTVKCVAAGARNDAGGRAAGAAIFRRCIRGQNPEFGNGIDRRANREATIHAVHIRRSIQNVAVGFRPLAVDRVGLPTAQQAARFGKPRCHRCDSGLQQTELREVAAIERQIRRLLRSDHVADRRVQIGASAAGRHVHLAPAAGDHQIGGEAHGAVDVNVNAGHSERREAHGGDPQFVVPDRQGREVKRSVLSGLLRRRETRLGVLRRDDGMYHDSIRRIEHLAFQNAGRILCVAPRAHEKQGEKTQCFHFFRTQCWHR